MSDNAGSDYLIEDIKKETADDNGRSNPPQPKPSDGRPVNGVMNPREMSAVPRHPPDLTAAANTAEAREDTAKAAAAATLSARKPARIIDFKTGEETILRGKGGIVGVDYGAPETPAKPEEAKSKNVPKSTPPQTSTSEDEDERKKRVMDTSSPERVEERSKGKKATQVETPNPSDDGKKRKPKTAQDDRTKQRRLMRDEQKKREKMLADREDLKKRIKELDESIEDSPF
ncbi:hypothetical protein KC356_g8027 [Hortaea werneckii]|nr:hypothetical protein KC356_g8027 [Hortaea werneckii]